MKIEVRYLSKGRNTKKIADVIALEFGVKAENIDKSIDNETDIYF